MIIGMNGASRWGATQAATIRNAGIAWARIELGTDTVSLARTYGFNVMGILANSADGTPITTLNNATQAALAVSQAQNDPGAAYFEFMNEPWLKGGQSWAVKYGQMYMSALTALRSAGINTPLLYATTGDYFQPGTSLANCTITSGSAVITTTSGSTTANLCNTQTVTGTNIPGGATILSVNSDTQFTISANATASGTRTLTIGSSWSQCDDTNEGWLGQACFHVPGLAAAVLQNGTCHHPYGMPTETNNGDPGFGHISGISSLVFQATYLARADVLGGVPPMWVTEFGYKYDGVTSGATSGVLVLDQAEQALRTDQAFSTMIGFGNIRGAFFYESHDDSGGNWGCMDTAGATRPAFNTIAAYANAQALPAGPMVIGLNAASTWGSTQAATILGAHIDWARVELGTDSVATAVGYGFKVMGILANSADGTLITTLTDSTQAALAVSQAQGDPGALYYEFMNEPWLKGSQAWPVKYGQMYMAALTAMRSAGITQPLLFATTGDYFQQGTTLTNCTITNASNVITTTSGSTTANLCGTQTVTGTNIPAGATIVSVNSDTQFTISANATASGSRTLTIGGSFSQCGDTHEGWLAQACFHVPGLAAAVRQNGVCHHPYGMPNETNNGDPGFGHSSGISSLPFHITYMARSDVLGATPQMWVTEFGYRYDGVTSGATSGVLVFDQTEQALRAGQALTKLVSFGTVRGSFWYESHDDSGGNWGVMEVGGATRPAFSTLASFAPAGHDASGGSANAQGGDIAVFTFSTALEAAEGLAFSSTGTVTVASSGAQRIATGGFATAHGGTSNFSSPSASISAVRGFADAVGGIVGLSNSTQPGTSVVHSRPPLRLHASIVMPNGRIARWGADEHRAENVLSNLAFSSTMPGGFESCSCVLPRQPGLDYQDLEEFATVTVAGSGGQVAWEGRIERTPRTSGDSHTVSPNLSGWQSHLDDDKTARMIYVDMDQTHWQAPSAQRVINLGNEFIDLVPGSAATDQTTGVPTVITGLSGPWARYAVAESWYDAHGMPISNVYYAWKQGGLNYNDTHWHWLTLLATDDVATGYEGSAELRGPGPGSGILSATVADRRFAVAQLQYDTAAGADNQLYNLYWTCLAVYGRHSLSGAGSYSDTQGAGIYSSDIVRHAVNTWAPRLATSRAGVGTVQPSNWIIYNQVHFDPTTASEIIKQASRFDLQDWGVWDGPTFYWAPRGYYGRNWRARVGPAQLAENGPQADRIYNGVIVRFNDVSGTVLSVGPVGSGATYETAELQDLDPTNPANELGIRKWQALQMGVSAYDPGTVRPGAAIKIGQRFLADQRELNTSGEASLVGHVQDDHGVLWPAWMVRAGDSITFIDAHDPVPRHIVRAEYTDQTKTCQISLDSPSEALTAYLERLSVSIAPLGFT